MFSNQSCMMFQNYKIMPHIGRSGTLLRCESNDHDDGSQNKQTEKDKSDDSPAVLLILDDLLIMLVCWRTIVHDFFQKIKYKGD